MTIDYSKELNEVADEIQQLFIKRRQRAQLRSPGKLTAERIAETIALGALYRLELERAPAPLQPMIEAKVPEFARRALEEVQREPLIVVPAGFKV